MASSRILVALLVAACHLADTVPIHHFDRGLTAMSACHCHEGSKGPALGTFASLLRDESPMCAQPPQPFLVWPLALRGGGTHDGGRKKMKKLKMMEEARTKRFEEQKRVAEKDKKAKQRAKQQRREQR